MNKARRDYAERLAKDFSDQLGIEVIADDVLETESFQRMVDEMEDEVVNGTSKLTGTPKGFA